MSDSLRPHRRKPTRLPRPWGSPGKNTGVGCHFLLQCMKVKVKSLSRVRLLATPWTPAYQAPPSMGFSRQEYWSGVPFSLVNQTPRAVLVGATSRSRVHMTPTENLQAEAIQTYLHFFFFFFRNLVYFPHLFQKYSSYIKSSAVT